MGISISRRAFLASAACQGFALLGQDTAFPFVKSWKPLFARGEQVRVWVGIVASGKIPREKQKSGVLRITRPDGVRETRPVSWPIDGIGIDGPGEFGWRGGVTLDNSSIMTGLYRFSFEWDQKQSAEAELTVREWDQRDRIITRWVFEGDDFKRATATLRVENRTFQMLRFCRLGMTGADVWLSCKQDGSNSSEQSLPYPWKDLMPAEDTYPKGDTYEARWQDLEQLPIETVKPGGQFSQELTLAKAQLVFPVTNPEVQIGTTVTLFLGEQSEAGAELYPVRLYVGAKHKFV